MSRGVLPPALVRQCVFTMFMVGAIVASGPAVATKGIVKLAIVLSGSVLALGGCATSIEGPYPFSEGWREARVERLLAADDLEKPWFWSCTRGSSAAQRRGHRYAILSYRAFGRRQYRLVEHEAGINLRPQQQVYLQAGSCRSAVVAVWADGATPLSTVGASPRS